MESVMAIGWAALGMTALLLVGCSDDGNASSGGAGGGGTTTGSTSATGGAGGSSTSSTGGGGSSTSSGPGGGGGDIPGGGTILFEEPFDDTDFMARGWYDGPAGALSSDTPGGSGMSFECAFATGNTSCTDGKPARHKFTDSETVYMSMWIKFSDNWVGSGVGYHPHMFHFITNLDPDYIGPANSHLTTYQEVVEGRAMLAIQDSLNVDTNCILLNNDSFVGCNGDFDSYVFTEDRSVAACNGLDGFVDGRDCFDSGYWYSSRAWRTPNAVFTDSDWHFVEIYYEMNSIEGGIGVPNGKIRWVQDGQTLITSDEILLRTGANPTMAFNQFAMLPYIGPGSPIDQSYFVDDLVVATARP